MQFQEALIAALIAGFACGLVPLVFGLARGRVPLAVGGLVACVAAGAVLGLLLAIPVAALFVFLIWRSTRERAAVGTAS